MEEYIKKLNKKLPTIKDEELKELIQKLIGERQNLSDSAKIDELTGLYNRKKLDDVNEYSAVVLCDVDNFKNINDSYGHDIGDKVLKFVGDCLKSNTRTNDIVCRYGGDEFLIIFKSCPFKVVVDRMSKIEAAMITISKKVGFDVSLSIGISEYKVKDTLDKSIINADKALYYSKKHGKKQLSIYDEIKDLK